MKRKIRIKFLDNHKNISFYSKERNNE